MSPEVIAKHLGLDQESMRKSAELARDPRAMAIRLEEMHASEAEYFDVPRSIGGIPVRTMTLEDHAALCVAGSPFMVGGEVYGEDIAIFIWRLATAYTHGESQEREAFFAVIHEADPVALRVEITSYLLAMYGQRVSEETFLAARYFVAPIVLEIGAESGWREADILAMPLPRVFAYLKTIKERQQRRAEQRYATGADSGHNLL